MMSDLKTSSNDKLFAILEDLHKFDYVRFSAPDIHNVMRSRVVPARSAAKFLIDGVSAAPIWCIVKPNGLGIFEEVKHLQSLVELRKAGNILLAPTLSTWHEAGWASKLGEWRTANIFCELRMLDNSTPVIGCVRSIARHQLERLELQGLSLMSGIELEFRLQENGKPIWPDIQLYSSLLLSKAMPFLNRVEKDLYKAGISLTTLETEHAAGQIELNYKPAWGINGADWPTVIREALKETGQSEGKEVNFMSRPVPLDGETSHDSGAGAHFNHSIWDKEGKTNMFYDQSAQYNLSTFAHQWIAGLVKHSPALTALFCPTVNCYRRMKGDWTANDISWGIDTRFTSYRIKSGGSGSTYVEARSPSGLSSPYLVMAATIAAGMDGVDKKMDLKIPMPEGFNKPLPDNLESALVELEKNDILKNALGESFVEWYCLVKRKGEIEVLQGDNIDKEIEMYAKFC